MTVIYRNFQSTDCEIILDILQHLSTTNRFSLMVEFLNSKEKELVKEMFRKLHEVSQDECQSNAGSNDSLKELAITYKVDL